MPSIIACDHASMSWKRMLVSPVTSFRHSADSGSASALQRSAAPCGASSSRMRSAWAWNCRRPGVAHRARRHRGKHRLPLGHVRIAVLAHHVVAHQHVHQPGRLVRGEHVDALFLREDVVAPGEHGGAELRHERDRRFLPHPRQRRVGIGPERRDVDVEMRGVGHAAVTPPGSRRRPSRSFRRRRPTDRRRGRSRGRRCLPRCRRGPAGCDP